MPQTYAEAFIILGANNILDTEFAYFFAKIAGFRNILAHDYDTLDGQRICNALLPGLDQVHALVDPELTVTLMDLVSQHILMQIGYKWSHKAALIPY